MSTRSIALIFGLAGLAACEDRPERPATVTDVRSGILKVTTGRGVSLEVLDWGGNGLPLVFLAGGGSATPHIYDDFAPRFTDRHRVIGITRRGNGGSSAVRPRGFDDYVEDIVAVLDALKFHSAVLVGHSFAGLELAAFGEKYSERCAGLIYLDAAYDYTDKELERTFEANMPPEAPPMQAADSASMDAVLAWSARTQGFRPPKSALRANRRWGADGRLLGSVRSPSADWNIDWRKPRWGAVSCPALGIYAMPAPFETSLPYWSSLDSAKRASANAYFAAFEPWTKKNREAFGRFPQNEVVEFPSASHYFYLEKPDEAARAINIFLARVETSRTTRSQGE